LRGLETLLEIWPLIKEEVPLATLDIYYGRQTYIAGTEQKIAEIVAKISKLSNLGVRERGKISHEELCAEMQDSSFLLYPYAGGSETFCITALTAAACGCLPIVCKRDALKDTLSIQQKDLLDPAEFASMAIELMRDEERANALRVQYAQYARQYTWKRAAATWHSIFQGELEDSESESSEEEEVRCKVIEE
jgi:glycosyltransferase involved in cell wall biosynthesis